MIQLPYTLPLQKGLNLIVPAALVHFGNGVQLIWEMVVNVMKHPNFESSFHILKYEAVFNPKWLMGVMATSAFSFS